MSEVNNQEELNEVVTLEVEDSEELTAPIDTTLTVSGAAADAKTVGDRFAAVENKTAGDINYSSAAGSPTVAAAIDAAAGRTGADIPVSSTDTTTVNERLQSLGASVTEIGQGLENLTAADLPVSDSEETTVEERLTAIQEQMSAIEEEIGGKTGEDIPVSSTDSTKISAKLTEIEESIDERTADEIALSATDETTVTEALAKCVKTVNGVEADETGNAEITTVDMAENLESSLTQTVESDFAVRTSGGNASITDGDGWLAVIRGGRVHEGYVAEELDMTVNAMEREEGVEPITATIDRDTFVAYVDSSGTIMLIYTTDWSADPELYGITVTGDPVSGDYITVVYVKEERGTIIQSNPQSFVSTDWNLYDDAEGYARVAHYSDEYGYMISGAYTSLFFAETEDGAQQAITVVDGNFTVPADGYVFVVGGDSTSTAIWATWSDWTENYSGSFTAYEESVVDLSAVMARYFPYGLLQVGNLQDEININVGIATSYVTRMAYSAANLAAAKATGRAYEYDENYIYIARASAEMYTVSIDGQYTANDHGMEIFEGTETALFARTIYGNNLKNKLERDVLTISAQTLSSAQKAQVQQNIGLNVANNLSTTDDGSVLDARQGKALNDSISSLSDSLATKSNTVSGTLDDGTSYQLRMRKIGNIVVANMSLSATSKFTDSSITLSGIIPTDYRPTSDYVALVSGRSSGAWASNSFVPVAVRLTANAGGVLLYSTALTTCGFINGEIVWTQ